MKTKLLTATRSAILALGFLSLPAAWAGLFDDDEARRAILDLRQRAEQQSEQIQQLQRNILDDQNQFESLRADLARLRGEKEELAQQLKLQQDSIQAVDGRLRKFEPSTVKVDGVEFLADPAESRSYDDAMAYFRQGDFKAAAAALSDFQQRYPRSGYFVPSLFWLGNAQYANREYKDAIRNFSLLLSKAPDHMRAPDSMLSIGNCQLELKDLKAARKAFEDLMAKYPNTDAASAARERLSKLK